jgi:hypothetical protein
MKVISLGYTCYVKSIIATTKYNKETDVFDWMNSFEFNKIIKSIDNKFDIFSNIIKSPLEVDLQSNVLYSSDYSFRLPHETNMKESIITYKRRFERFIKYKTTQDNYLFIRLINTGRYGINAENIEENYNERSFNAIILYLPPNSKILLITDEKMTTDNKNKIYNGFYIADDVINPEHICFGKYTQYRNKIIQCYKSCFEYIDRHFNSFNANDVYKYIKNEHIGI